MNDDMDAAARKFRPPTKLQCGNGYARGGRVAMKQYEGSPKDRAADAAAMPSLPPPKLPRGKAGR